MGLKIALEKPQKCIMFGGHHFIIYRSNGKYYKGERLVADIHLEYGFTEFNPSESGT
jgi:hypothetical protein